MERAVGTQMEGADVGTNGMYSTTIGVPVQTSPRKLLYNVYNVFTRNPRSSRREVLINFQYF